MSFSSVRQQQQRSRYRFSSVSSPAAPSGDRGNAWSPPQWRSSDPLDTSANAHRKAGQVRGDSLPEPHSKLEPYRPIPRGLVDSEPLGSDMRKQRHLLNTRKSDDEKQRLTSPVKVMKKGLEKQMLKLLYSSCSNVILLSCGEKVKGEEQQPDGLLVKRSGWASHRP